MNDTHGIIAERVDLLFEKRCEHLSLYFSSHFLLPPSPLPPSPLPPLPPFPSSSSLPSFPPPHDFIYLTYLISRKAIREAALKVLHATLSLRYCGDALESRYGHMLFSSFYFIFIYIFFTRGENNIFRKRLAVLFLYIIVYLYKYVF